jgi:hypothetical protein
MNDLLTSFPFAQLLWWVFASLAVGGALGTITRWNRGQSAVPGAHVLQPGCHLPDAGRALP